MSEDQNPPIKRDNQIPDIELHQLNPNRWLAVHVETEVVGVGESRKTALETLDESLSRYYGFSEVLSEDKLY